MRYLSLFSGIGGFELGIQKAYERIQKLCVEDEKQRLQGVRDKKGQQSKCNNLSTDGFTCIGYSEIDKYAIQIYQKQFPEHKNYGDVTKIKTEELPDFDLLVGGFPCQAFSIAGKRLGFDDTRGTLFFDIARILKEKRPRNFVLENVKGLLSHDSGRTFKTIISTLVELGYCVEWQVLNAKNFGVPQNRERVFIVGHLGGEPARKVFPIGETTQRISEQDGRLRGEVCSNEKGGHKSDNNGKILQDVINRSLHLRQLKGGSQGERVYDPSGIATTIASQAGGLGAKTGLYLQDMKIRRLTPLECERLMGYPDGWTEGLSDTQRYKCLGNGVVSNVVAEVIKGIIN